MEDGISSPGWQKNITNSLCEAVVSCIVGCQDVKMNETMTVLISDIGLFQIT